MQRKGTCRVPGKQMAQAPHPVLLGGEVSESFPSITRGAKNRKGNNQLQTYDSGLQTWLHTSNLLPNFYILKYPGPTPFISGSLEVGSRHKYSSKSPWMAVMCGQGWKLLLHRWRQIRISKWRTITQSWLILIFLFRMLAEFSKILKFFRHFTYTHKYTLATKEREREGTQAHVLVE